MNDNRAKGDWFCDVCDIVKDLHPQPYDEANPGCDGAGSKARILDLFRVAP